MPAVCITRKRSKTSAASGQLSLAPFLQAALIELIPHCSRAYRLAANGDEVLEAETKPQGLQTDSTRQSNAFFDYSFELGYSKSVLPYGGASG